MCPDCSASAVRRQLTAPQFRLAGGGWYETDFKKDGDKKRNLAGDAAGDSKPRSATKSDAKPETKTASETKAVTPAASPKPAAGSSAT